MQDFSKQFFVGSINKVIYKLQFSLRLFWQKWNLHLLTTHILMFEPNIFCPELTRMFSYRRCFLRYAHLNQFWRSEVLGAKVFQLFTCFQINADFTILCYVSATCKLSLVRKQETSMVTTSNLTLEYKISKLFDSM